MELQGLIYKVFNYYDPHSHLQSGETRQVSCLFKTNHEHGDWKKSARVYGESENYHCFKCGFTYDAIQLVMEMEQIDFKSALQFIKDIFYIDLSNTYKPKVNQDELDAYRTVIEGLVIEKRFKNFNKIYKALDDAWVKGDLKRLRYLFEGVKNA